jgi:hypothetical protein
VPTVSEPTPEEIVARIRTALLRVADNVARHEIQRGGWEPDDECFQIDLKASETELAGLYQKVTAERDALREEVQRLRNRTLTYLKAADGRVAETRELVDGKVFADFDAAGELLGIEVLVPCQLEEHQ